MKLSSGEEKDCDKRKESEVQIISTCTDYVRKSDEEHYITMSEIKEKLEEYEVTADRKSIYNDLKDLEKLGIEVEGEPVGNRYHYHGRAPIELPN